MPPKKMQEDRKQPKISAVWPKDTTPRQIQGPRSSLAKAVTKIVSTPPPLSNPTTGNTPRSAETRSPAGTHDPLTGSLAGTPATVGTPANVGTPAEPGTRAMSAGSRAGTQDSLVKITVASTQGPAPDYEAACVAAGERAGNTPYIDVMNEDESGQDHLPLLEEDAAMTSASTQQSTTESFAPAAIAEPGGGGG